MIQILLAMQLSLNVYYKYVLILNLSFIACILIIVSQIVRNKNKLWKIVDKNLNNTNSENYDNLKRDPVYTNADEFPLNELLILTNHYHPSIQKFANFILQNYNKDIIAYDGDPLTDFSLVNFLDKFMLKNPKIKSDKGKKKVSAQNKRGGRS